MGSARVTYDVDPCYRRTPANLKQLHPPGAQNARLTLRGTPADLKFRLDARALALARLHLRGRRRAVLDLPAYLEPVGTYDDSARTVRVIGLDDLLRIRRHLGRPKDRESLLQRPRGDQAPARRGRVALTGRAIDAAFRAGPVVPRGAGAGAGAVSPYAGVPWDLAIGDGLRGGRRLPARPAAAPPPPVRAPPARFLALPEERPAAKRMLRMLAMVAPPRLPLVLGPTPILKLDRLSRELGVELYVKRDDLTGLVETGNKTASSSSSWPRPSSGAPTR